MVEAGSPLFSTCTQVHVQTDLGQVSSAHPVLLLTELGADSSIREDYKPQAFQLRSSCSQEERSRVTQLRNGARRTFSYTTSLPPHKHRDFSYCYS